MEPPKLLDFQVNPANQLSEAIEEYYKTGRNKGRLIVMPAGTGKTYVAGAALRRIQDVIFTEPVEAGQGRSFILAESLRRTQELRPARILVITPAAVKTQFTRVLLKFGVKDFLVTSHMSLTTTFGDGFLSWHSRMVNGAIHLEPTWDDDLKPDIIILDESQSVKNADTQIAQIIISAIQQGILVIFVSATPFTTLSETLVTCLGLRISTNATNHRDEMMGFINNYQDYKEHNAAAMARFNDYLIDQGLKVEAHGIKFAHRVFNKCILTDFENPKLRKFYDEAYDRYVAALRKIDKNAPEGWGQLMAEITKFREAAECCRSNYMARYGTEKVAEGKQVLIASNFRVTLDLVKQMLIENYKVRENRISIILGGQNATVRQNYIDRFQRGETDYCILTLKAGGAGLSLHHERPEARPRHCILPPTYSAIELVQLLGRAHRINSLSTTHQDIIWYRDTIEEHVSTVVQRKMKSLKEIVSKRETWLDLFTPAGLLNVDDQTNGHLADLKDEVNEDGDSIIDAMPVEAFEETEEEN
jgi:superfamily II DNA or RNA helicase